MGKIGQREAIRFLAARARQKREARRLARRERSEPVQTQTDDRPRWQAAFFEELRAVEVSGGSLRDLMEAQREFYRDAVSWLEGGLVALEHDLDPEKAAAVRMVQDSQRQLLPRVELLAVQLLKDAPHDRRPTADDIRPWVNALVTCIVPPFSPPPPKDALRRAKLIDNAMKRLATGKGMDRKMVNALSPETRTALIDVLSGEQRYLAGIGADPAAKGPGPSQDVQAENIALAAMDLWWATTGNAPTVVRSDSMGSAALPERETANRGAADPDGERSGDPGSPFSNFVRDVFALEASALCRPRPRGWLDPASRALRIWKARQPTRG